jgi:hypothetical protein
MLTLDYGEEKQAKDFIGTTQMVVNWSKSSD